MLLDGFLTSLELLIHYASVHQAVANTNNRITFMNKRDLLYYKGVITQSCASTVPLRLGGEGALHVSSPNDCSSLPNVVVYY